MGTHHLLGARTGMLKPTPIPALREASLKINADVCSLTAAFDPRVDDLPCSCAHIQYDHIPENWGMFTRLAPQVDIIR